MNRVHKFIDEDFISLVGLEDFINQLKEKLKRVIEAWLPLEQRFEDEETIKDYESISQGMDLFEDQYQDGLAKILKHSNLLSSQQTAKLPVGPVQIRLPKVKLIEFTSHVHDNTFIPKVTKYQYLSGVLSGPLAKLLLNYRATGASYDSAVPAIIKQYSNVRKQKDVAVDKLLLLKAPTFSEESIRFFQLDLEGAINELTNLNMDVKAAESFIQWIILNKLPETLKQKIYNEAREIYPFVDEMLLRVLR